MLVPPPSSEDAEIVTAPPVVSMVPPPPRILIEFKPVERVRGTVPFNVPPLKFEAEFAVIAGLALNKKIRR